METKTETLETIQERALNQRLRDECILVTLKWTDKKTMTPKLTFRIDYRTVEEWKRKLIQWGERFSMTDTRNGQLIYETHKLTEE